MFYFVAHRALADVEAVRGMLFCTQLKHLNDQHEPFLRPPLEQKNKYKSMVKIREQTKMLLLKFGRAISGTMAKKLQQRDLISTSLKAYEQHSQTRKKFMQFLWAKGLSSMCSQKLVAYFFQP